MIHISSVIQTLQSMDSGGQVDTQEHQDCEEVKMDINLWRQLQWDIVSNKVLAKLPMLDFHQVGTDCTTWESMRSGVRISEACFPSKATPQLFLIYPDSGRDSFITYDPDVNSWYLMPLPRQAGGSSFVVKAGAGSLLCLAETEAQAINLYVWNPITNHRRLLPPLIQLWRSYAVHMVVDRARNTYRILVILPISVDPAIQVYDSITDSWQMIGVANRHRQAMWGTTSSIEGVVYGLADDRISFYHMDQGVWGDLHAPMPSNLILPELFVSQGHLILVGPIVISSYEVFESVHVWQLNAQQTEWVELLQMPNDLVLKLWKGWTVDYRMFVAGGDHICFANYRSKQLLMCHLLKQSWWWMPLFPFPTGVGGSDSSPIPSNLVLQKHFYPTLLGVLQASLPRLPPSLPYRRARRPRNWPGFFLRPSWVASV